MMKENKLPIIIPKNYTQSIDIQGIPAKTLSEVVENYPLVTLVFLRHLGCRFCKTMVLNLKKLKTESPNFPPIIFVHQGTLEQGNNFFDNFWKGQTHIANPNLSLFHFFGLKSGSLRQQLGIRSWIKGIISVFKYGFKRTRQTKRIGNSTMLSGTFLFQKGTLVWAHQAKYVGDEPNWKLLV